MTTLQAPLPRGQLADAEQNLQQAILQAEDEEWPSQILSSVHHKDQEALPDTHVNEPDDHTAVKAQKGQSHDRIEQAFHQRPIKMALLTRPTSSGEYLAAGFSFGVPPPLQLDLTRNKTRETAPPAPEESQKRLRSQTPGSHRSSPPSGQANSTNAPASASCGEPAPMRIQKLPFPNVCTEVMPKQHHPGTKPAGKLHGQQPTPTASGAENTFVSVDDTFVESDPHGKNWHQPQNDLAFNSTKPAANAIASGYAQDLSTDQDHRQQDMVAKTVGRGSPIDTEARPRTKIRKTRRKTQSSIQHKGLSENPNSPGDQEELLHLLLYKTQQAALHRQRTQEIQEAKDAELQRSVQISNELYAQLQDLSQRYSTKEAQLSKIKASKLGWESRLKKLSDYVKGLTNDHNKLRDDANLIRELQTSVGKDKDGLIEALREVYQATQKGKARSTQFIKESRRDLEMLNQTMQRQKLKLDEEQELLASERERNSQLEEQITAFSAGHAQLKDLFASHREAITGKINDLLDRTSQHVEANASEASQNNLKPMLEQCVTLLRDLPKADGGTKPTEFRKLENKMSEYFDSITRSVKACDRNTSAIESGHQRLASSVHNELQALSSNIATEHTLSEQIMDLREMRAAVRERLQSAETALKDSRLRIITLEHNEAEYIRRITYLEDGRGQQPAEDPQTLLRLHESDLLNKDLRSQLTTQVTEADSLGNQLQQKATDLSDLQTKMEGIESMLEGARQQTALAQDEKTKIEEQAVLEREKMRCEILKASSLEVANLKSLHSNTVQQLKAKNTADENSNKVADQLIAAATKEKERLETEASKSKRALEALQLERQNDAIYAQGLRRRIDELEKKAQEKDASYDSLCQQLRDKKTNDHSKNGHTKAQLAYEAKKNAERSPFVRASNTSVTVPSKSSVIVQDSQPAEEPKFASHQDIMGTDDSGLETAELLDANFVGGSHVAEDLSGLFPGTPPKERRTVEFTNVSYSRRRISSREGEVTPSGPKAISGNVRQSSQWTGSKGVEFSNANILPSTSGRKPQPNHLATKSVSTNPSPKPSQPQRPSQDTGNAPRGILKQATQEIRGQKRAGADTEVSGAAGFTATKRRKSSAVANGLGPIIADSQSPISKVGGSRSRKLTTRHGTKGTREDIYMSTFNGYTTNGQLIGSQ